MTVLQTLTIRRSGKVGQVIHSRNAAGPYIRPVAFVFDPQTVRQLRRRARFTVISRFWKNQLTAPERRSWDDFASRIDFTNRIGISRALNGQQLFIRNNAGRPQVIHGIIRTAPLTASNGTYIIPGVVDFGGFGTVIVTINTGDAWVTQNNAFMFVYVSDRRSPTINFFNGPFRFAGSIAGSSTDPPGPIQPLTDPFGAAPENRRTARTRVAFADGRLTAATLRRFTDSS